MWLIDTITHRLVHSIRENELLYAILSHTWEKGEVTHLELLKALDTAKRRVGWKKIVFTCMQARRDGLTRAWVDTCCIDKSSSAELSEASLADRSA